MSQLSQTTLRNVMALFEDDSKQSVQEMDVTPWMAGAASGFALGTGVSNLAHKGDEWIKKRAEKKRAEKAAKAGKPVEEALRLKATHAHEDGIHVAKVYKDNDWDEHRIKYYRNGQHTGEDSDGFADSLEDANDTAKADLNHMAKHYKPVNEDVAVNEISDAVVKNYFDKSREAKRADGYGFDHKGDVSTQDRNRAWQRMKSMNKAQDRLHDAANPVSVEVHDMSHMNHGEAYDYTQTHDEVKDGHVLKLAGGHSAIMYKAWPTMVHGDSKEMHSLNDTSDWATMHKGRYKESAEVAHKVSAGDPHGKPEHKASWSSHEFNESVDDFKAPAAPTDMGNVNPMPETRTLVDYIKNATLSKEYSPLINFLKAHKVEVYSPSPDDAKNTGDMFSADSTPTYDRAAHRQGYDQEQTQAAWDSVNPDVDEYEYLSRLNKSREKMYAKVHDMWKGERQ